MLNNQETSVSVSIDRQLSLPRRVSTLQSYVAAQVSRSTDKAPAIYLDRDKQPRQPDAKRKRDKQTQQANVNAVVGAATCSPTQVAFDTYSTPFFVGRQPTSCSSKYRLLLPMQPSYKRDTSSSFVRNGWLIIGTSRFALLYRATGVKKEITAHHTTGDERNEATSHDSSSVPAHTDCQTPMSKSRTIDTEPSTYAVPSSPMLMREMDDMNATSLHHCFVVGP